MTEPKLYSKIPVSVWVIPYTNRDDQENVQSIIEFTDEKFRTIDNGTSIITAEVYDELHDTWVGVKDGDYIIQGLQGEFYPHDGALFPHAYIESWQQEAIDLFKEVSPS